MKRVSLNPILLAFIAFLFVLSCVPAKKFEDMKDRREQCEERNEKLRSENERLNTKNNELSNKISHKEKTLDKLTSDTLKIGQNYRQLKKDYDQLNKTYKVLLEKNEKLLEGERSETQRILSRLQEIQKDLQKREDELQKATIKLKEKEKGLAELNTRLQESLKEVQLKDERLTELEDILNKQNEAVNSLMSKVSTALLGFEGEGLSVDIRQGKVYVSLEESLLFESGRYAVDPEGVKALKQLAKVLELNPDINVMVEGHTDDVPVIPSGDLQDNWDLSVLRATSIIKILLEHGNIEPQRLIAAGRGEYMPIDPAKTPEARRKNRRTEIILTPQLDELFEIIESYSY